MNRQQKEFYKLFSEHGTGEAKVSINPQEILLLLCITTSDLSIPAPEVSSSVFNEISRKGFFHISHEDLDVLPEITADECFESMEKCGVTDINNMCFLYLKNLCDLFRRRVKYYHVLKNQPFPSAEQIAPRSLLEYGNCENQLLADWLEWRKWIFDIDNRSAQETGYTFEPILASCLGGEPRPSSNSPVKRIDDNGNITTNGRQVDCYIEELNEVYELKMRVTIAASGQGRFSEEMSFPYEAQQSGCIPILVVFDGTDSDRLEDLKAQYQKCGGRVYIGEEAWKMLLEKAGEGMKVFIEKYIYPPISAMKDCLHSNPRDITLTRQPDKIIIKGENESYIIQR